MLHYDLAGITVTGPAWSRSPVLWTTSSSDVKDFSLTFLNEV